ncbi:MAG: hypothetical protein IPK03_10875 [Bacteroidetes bacterium]|nr:hypothetical protein [Bacteroidota bacterium]
MNRGKVVQLSISVALVSILYLMVVSNKFYERFDENNAFGLEIPPAKNPIGAVNFINQNLKGKKGFSDFFVSNYALWAGRPHFKSFLDLRDLDIFTAAAYKNSLYLLQNPPTMVSPTQTIWQLADSADHYDYVLVLNRRNSFRCSNFFGVILHLKWPIQIHWLLFIFEVKMLISRIKNLFGTPINSFQITL